MTPREIVRIVGIGFLFTTALTWIHGRGPSEESVFLLGILPGAQGYDVAHVALGVWAIASGRTTRRARAFLRFGGLATLGLGFGAFVSYFTLGRLDLIAPEAALHALRGADVWLHLAVGTILSVLASAGVPSSSGVRPVTPAQTPIPVDPTFASA